MAVKCCYVSYKDYSGVIDRRRVGDIDAFGSETMSRDERTAWIERTLRVSREDAERYGDSINYFTSDYESIHDGTDTYNNEQINRAIENKNAPVYSGMQWRGLHLDIENMPAGVTPRQFIEKIIRGGVWKENGATSFSASRAIAEHTFADIDHWQNGPNRVPVVIRYQGRTGMPIKHMSDFTHEDEVLHSQKQMKRGYDIVDHHWEKNNTVVYITIADKRRK